MSLTRIGLDTAKAVVHVHGVNEAGHAEIRRALHRRDGVACFTSQPACTVGLEACGASHYWAHELARLGHEVTLLPAQYVKAYLKRGKNDERDAEAGCEAMARPTMRTVPAKTAEQQAVLMLLTLRARLVRQRTQLTNAIRGHAAEFGLIAPRGLDRIGPLLERAVADEALPQLARDLFAQMADEHLALRDRIEAIEARLMAQHRADPASRRLAQIPGVGPIGAMMLAAKTPDPSNFRSARDYAAWAGLTPKDHSTAGKARMGVITKAGDEALRAVLVCGAMAVIQQVKAGKPAPWPWLASLLQTKTPKQAAVALANKIARIAWRIMIDPQDYDPARHLNRPQTALAA